MDVTGSTSGQSALEVADVTDVVDTVLPARPARRKAPATRRYTDTIYHGVSLAVALSLVLILGAIVAVLVTTAWPAITRLGPGFLTGATWNPYVNVFGALPFIAGTLLTTAIALALAAPVSLAIALLLTEYAPRRLAAALGVVIDVAAGVPTVVFGAWGILALVPWLRTTVDPAVSAALGWVPYVGHAPLNQGGFNAGFNVLAACLVLAAMIFPTATAVIRSLLLVTPLDLREASLALGATGWETATRVVLRQARSGIVGAIVLACGRALGETIAVAAVIGNAPFIPRSLFDQGATLSTQLFSQVYGSGVIPGTLTTATLYELGLILLALSLLASLGGRLLTRRLGGALITGGGR